MHRQRGYNLQAGAKDSWLQEGTCAQSIDFLPNWPSYFSILCIFIISIRAFNNTIADFTILPHEGYGKQAQKLVHVDPLDFSL